MAMPQSTTMEEGILYWLSLDTHVRVLAERLLQGFAVTVGDLPASAAHHYAESGGLQVFAGSGAQGSGRVRVEHEHGAADKDWPRPKAPRSEFSSLVEVLTPGGLL